MDSEVNIVLIKELTSVPFNKVRNRVQLLDLYEQIYGGKLCRTCTKDREFAYNKLKKYIENYVENTL